MLCQVTVSNYKCFRDSFTLDLQATNITEHEDSLLESKDGEKFLPLSVIYGPNGAGKSTVLEAVYSLACKIMRPICAVSCESKECERIDNDLIIVPFKFSKKTKIEPTFFELFFRTDIAEYQYNVSFVEDKVIEERLDKKNLEGKRYTSVFKRKGKEILLYGSLKSYLCKDVSSNLTLLSFLGITHKRNSIIKDIVNWFEHKFRYIDYGSPLREGRIPINNQYKPLILKMLQEMDVDISDYRVERKDKKIKVYTTHIIDDSKYDLRLTEESSGTIKLFAILQYVAESLQSGATLLIDELDAKIHPVLLKYIIHLFSDQNINKNGAQLIFTSHDLSTMNSEVFRRDEIWFVAKGSEQNASLYSLVEIKNDGVGERKDCKYSKRYLEGKYGADPYLKNIINWEEI